MPQNWKQLSRMETRLFTATQSHGILSCVNDVNFGAHHSFMMTLYLKLTPSIFTQT